MFGIVRGTEAQSQLKNCPGILRRAFFFGGAGEAAEEAAREAAVSPGKFKNFSPLDSNGLLKVE